MSKINVTHIPSDYKVTEWISWNDSGTFGYRTFYYSQPRWVAL